MTTTRRFSLPLPLLVLNLALLALLLLSLFPLESLSSSAFDENEASWTRKRWESAPFKLPLPFRVLRGGGGGGGAESGGEGAAAEERRRSPSSSPSPSSAPSSTSSPSLLPASSLLGPLSASSLARRLAARDADLARDAWQRDESDAAGAAEALACDACRAAVGRGWELGAAWVALQGRAEARRGKPMMTPPVAAAASASSKGPAAAAAAAAAAAGGPLTPPPPPQQQQQQQQQQPETVFLLPAQLRQRLTRGLRAWCEREGEQGGRNGRSRRISPGSALEGARLVREQEQQGDRWRRVERPPPGAEAAATTGAAAATPQQPPSARERLAARLSCSRLLFAPPPSPFSAAAAPGTNGAAPPPPPDPAVVAALADGLSLFAAALSRAANSAEAGRGASSDESGPAPPRLLLPPTLLPGRRPQDETGRPCADFNPECGGWAALGECEANPGYMIGDDDDDDGDDVFFSDSSDAAAAAAAAAASSSDRGSSSASSSSKSSGSDSSSSRSSGPKRRRSGFCRFSCGVCSPLPRGFPSSSPASPSAPSAPSILAAVARLPANSHEAASLEAEALAIKEGVLLRACYAAKPCGGRGGGEKRFGRWFGDGGGGEEEDEEEEEKLGGSNNKNNATLPSPSAASAAASSSSSPLHGRCFVSAAGWWLYEVCVGGGIRQFHPPTSPRDAPAANSLGAFSDSSSDSSSREAPRGGEAKWLSAAELYRGAPLREEAVDGESKVFAFVEQRYENGDPCLESESEEGEAKTAAGGGVRRSATLRLVCPAHASARDVDAVPRLLVAEPQTCLYVVTLFHPEACALVRGSGGGGAAAEAAEAAPAEKAEEGAVPATEAAAAGAESVAAAAPAPPEEAADAAAVPLPSPDVIPPPPPPPASAAHDEL